MKKIRKIKNHISHCEREIAYINNHNTTRFYKKKPGYFLNQIAKAYKKLNLLNKNVRDERN